MTDINHDATEDLARDLLDDGVPLGDELLLDFARAYLDMRARNERLREAAEPFGRIAVVIPWTVPDDTLVGVGRYLPIFEGDCREFVADKVLTVGDIRRARAAMEGKRC